MTAAQRALAEQQALGSTQRLSSAQQPKKSSSNKKSWIEEVGEWLIAPPGSKASNAPFQELAGRSPKSIGEEIEHAPKNVEKAGENIGKEANKALGVEGGLLGQFFQGAGIRLLEIVGGALLVLFGLYVLVKGEPPNVGKVVAHAV